MLKVAVVTQYFPTSVQQWAGHSAYQTLRLLSKRFDLHVFYPEATYPGRFTPANAKRTAIDRTWQPPDVAVTYVPYPAFPVISRPVNGFTMAAKLLPHVERYKPDAILNYTVYPDGLAAIQLARRLGVPSVLTAIGSDLNRVTDPFRRWLTRYTLQHASKILTVSRDLGRTAVTLGADPARVLAILNGCDTQVFHPRNKIASRTALGIETDLKLIVYVGRLDLRKGLIELVGAMFSLLDFQPTAKLFIVGDGPDRPKILEAIQQRGGSCRGAHEWVKLVPSCSTAQVAHWISASDLLTLPSYQEGCPNVVLEGLASGRPLVVTNVGGIPELVSRDAGRLVPSRDVPSLTEAFRDVLSSKWDQDYIAKKHTRSWQDVADELGDVIVDVRRRFEEDR